MIAIGIAGMSQVRCSQPLSLFLGIYYGLAALSFVQSIGLYSSVYLKSKSQIIFLKIKHFIINPLNSGWLVYGNYIYFTGVYKCVDEVQSQTGTLLLVLIIIGYF